MVQWKVPTGNTKLKAETYWWFVVGRRASTFFHLHLGPRVQVKVSGPPRCPRLGPTWPSPKVISQVHSITAHLAHFATCPWKTWNYSAKWDLKKIREMIWETKIVSSNPTTQWQGTTGPGGLIAPSPSALFQRIDWIDGQSCNFRKSSQTLNPSE